MGEAQLQKQKSRENWSSRFGFVMAAAGSAVGLGNIWKFPYMAGENGGAAFVFVYLLAVIFIGFTVMLCELAIGRASGQDAIGAFKKLAPKKAWWITGAMGIISAFLILSFYGVVAGWSMAYIFKTLTGAFSGVPIDDLPAVFGKFTSNPIMPVIWQLIFMALTITIVLLGISNGIERWSKILMPAIIFILILMIFRGLTLKGGMEGLHFYMNPDFSKITGEVILMALGQAFFTLSLGMGTMITYGSYLSNEENLPSSAITVAGLDTFIALLAGFAIFPAVFAAGISPSGGPGLVFMILPFVFEQLPLGTVFGGIFFFLLTIAALTSSISILEVLVAFFRDQLGWKRNIASIVLGSVVAVLGIFVSLSQGVLSHVKFPLPGQDPVDLFGLFDFLASNIFLPLGGLLICLFTVYVWKKENANQEVTNYGQFSFGWLPVWNFTAGIVAPIVIFFVLLNGLGII